ncbi:hypothetical protein [Variovorax atrisoli]|uniref:hypothetical protein n=1 Tax=Variovorax atrisoli TaxID=3394203 RepID=UPI0033996F06
MQQSNAVVELDALLMKSDPDSLDWAEYAYEDGKGLLARLNEEDRAVLFGSAKTKPSNWRGCLISILHPSKTDESEVLIGALGDVDDNVVGEALRRLYFYRGFNESTTKGVFEDRRLRVDSFWDRVRLDSRVVQRIEQLSQENRYISAYWSAFCEAAGKGGQLP